MKRFIPSLIRREFYDYKKFSMTQQIIPIMLLFFLTIYDISQCFPQLDDNYITVEEKSKSSYEEPIDPLLIP